MTNHSAIPIGILAALIMLGGCLSGSNERGLDDSQKIRVENHDGATGELTIHLSFDPDPIRLHLSGEPQEEFGPYQLPRGNNAVTIRHENYPEEQAQWIVSPNHGTLVITLLAERIDAAQAVGDYHR